MPSLRRCSRCLVSSILLNAILLSPAYADEVWVAPTYQEDAGGLGIGSNGFWPVTAIGASRFALGVPNNLQAFQSVTIVLIPHTPGGAATLNVFICAAEDGQLEKRRRIAMLRRLRLRGRLQGDKSMPRSVVVYSQPG